MSINTTNNDNNTLLYQQLKVPQQIQIDRLKQEDDEQWISGEELCTEGSSTDSDEDKANTDIKQILQQQKLQLQYQHKNKFKQKKYTNNINNKRKYKPSPLLNDSTTQLSDEPIATNKNCLTVEDANMDAGADAGECSSWRWRPKRGSIKLPIDSTVTSDHNTNDTTEQLTILESFNNLRKESDLNKFNEEFINKKLNEIKLFENKINKNHVHKMKLFLSRIQTYQQIKNFNLNLKNTHLFLKLCKQDFAKYQKMQENKKNIKCKNVMNKKRMNDKKQKQLTCTNNVILYKRKQYFIQNIINRNKKYIKECEDRRRLHQLLVDYDCSEHSHDLENENTNTDVPEDLEIANIVDNVFSYDKDLKEQLDNINEKLKMYSFQSACFEQSDILKSVLNNKKNFKPTDVYTSVFKPKVNNGTTANDANSSNPTKNKLLIIRKQLNKIDQDLNVYNQKYFNSVILPLPEEQMSTLLQNCIGNSTKKDQNTYLSPDICQKLIDDAKNTIPKFKYKYSGFIDDDQEHSKLKKNQINSSINKINQQNQRDHDISSINEYYEELFPNKPKCNHVKNKK